MIIFIGFNINFTLKIPPFFKFNSFCLYQIIKTLIIAKIKFIQISNLRYLIYPPAPAPVPAAEFKEILKLAKNLSSKNNSKLFFVFLPSYVRYVTKYDNTNYNLIKNIVRELDIPFVDIHKEVFEKEENPLKLFPFELIGHYNVEGYKKIAETLYKFTKD